MSTNSYYHIIAECPGTITKSYSFKIELSDGFGNLSSYNSLPGGSGILGDTN